MTLNEYGWTTINLMFQKIVSESMKAELQAFAQQRFFISTM